MTAWTERPPTVAAMLNPALLATALAAAAERYHSLHDEDMPWALSFLVAPLVLHRATREALPRTTRTHLANWILSEPLIAAGLPLRAASLVRPVREGIRFGIRTEVLTVTEGGRLHGESISLRKYDATDDLASIVRAAGMIGRWFAKLDQPATAFALLGIAP